MVALKKAMDYAPSVGNARPWRVFNVASPEKREQVRQIFEKANSKAQAIYETERANEYRKLKLEGIRVAPLQLAIFTESEPDAGHGLGRQSMTSTLEQSTAMAVQNLCLAARAFGLGTGMVSILDPEAMQKLFCVPPSWRFSFYLCIGLPSFTDDTPLLHKCGWQENIKTRWQNC
ncbi:hypothetical protein GCM10010136_24220 [Limoniibacter endophyticus]|uniref:Nitroreductase domain-containing protein n=2 Tax=Limoniibacter endophyticus TaxID=1565040 RepID=A0A8J3DRE6_9HYPH|nr:hypothetical protein GCM10010136_24220 [Limoniibacter endophyticus]